MTQQAVTDVTPARAARAAGELAGRDRTLDEAAVADELLVEEVSIDGMCGVY